MKELNELSKMIIQLRGSESVRKAAKRAGLSHNYLGILEKGYDPQTKAPINPSPDTLRSLSEAYNYNYEDLLRIAGYLDGEITNDQAKNVVGNPKYARLPQEKKKLIDDMIDAISEK